LLPNGIQSIQNQNQTKTDLVIFVSKGIKRYQNQSKTNFTFDTICVVCFHKTHIDLKSFHELFFNTY